MQPIYHLTTRSLWDAARVSGSYRQSTLGRTLDEVGFVHCCQESQLPALAARFAGAADLVALVIDPARLRADVRYENFEGGNELFPHVYGPIPVAAVIDVIPIHLGSGAGP